MNRSRNGRLSNSRRLSLLVIGTLVGTLAITGIAHAQQGVTPTGARLSADPVDATANSSVTERLQRLEQRAEVAAVQNQERFQSLNDRYESMFRLLQIVSIIAAVALGVLSINDIVQRRREAARQRGLDEVGKEMINLQKSVAEQQIDFGRLQLGHTNDSLQHQVQSVKSVNEVISVVRQTLDFRLEQERKVAQALHDIEEIRDERKRERDAKLKQAKSILEPFLQMSRMDFPALTEEQYKRGIKLRSLSEDLTFSPEDFDLSGSVFYACGVLAYYDNDIVDAKHFLQSAVDVRAADHEGALNTDEKYRRRFAFAHYFRALIQKNWGDIGEALHEINQSDRLLGIQPDEFLTPVTKAEIYSVRKPIDPQCQHTLKTLLEKMDSLEQAKRAEGKGLNQNQLRLRNRMLLLYGNTFFVDHKYSEALSKYGDAAGHNESDYYALASAGQCAAQLGDTAVAKKFCERAVRAVERSGDLTRKRERITRAVLAVTAAHAAHGANDEARRNEYVKQARELLSGNLAVDGLTPKFFSPTTKYLVTSEELLNELTFPEPVGV